MTTPSPGIRHAVGALAVALGITAAAIAASSVEAGQRPSALLEVDDDLIDPGVPATLSDVPDPPEATTPPTEPEDESPTLSVPDQGDPPQQPAPSPQNPQEFQEPAPGVLLVAKECSTDLAGYGSVSYLVRNTEDGGPRRNFIASVAGEGRSDTANFGLDDEQALRNRVERLPTGSYTLTVGTYGEDFVAQVAPTVTVEFTVEPCEEASPATSPDNTDATPIPAPQPGPTIAASDPDRGPADPTAAAGGSLDNTAVATSVGNVFRFADPDTPIGESTVIRTDAGVLATIWIGSLPPNEAVTLWWMVSNQPANCSPPGCGADDIFIDGDPTQGLNDDGIDAAGVVGGYATGTVVNADGTTFLVTRLDEGTPGVDVIVGDPDEPMLTDAAGAEIHLVARSHGPAVAGLEAIQTTSYTGGCDTMLHPPATPAAPGECADIAFTIHQP